MSLAGKVGIVTGGSRGIGLAVVELLLRCESQVVYCDIDRAEGEITLSRLQGQYGPDRVHFTHTDVADPARLEDVFKFTINTYKRLDIVYNNAGIFDEVNAWRRVVDTNLTSVINGTRLALQYMDKNKGGNGGSIVNVASIAGYYRFDVMPIYGATKHAVKAYTQNIGATSQQMYGVRVNVCCPGWTDTELVRRISSSTDDYFYGPNVEKTLNRVQEVGLLAPDIIARATLPLVSDVGNSGECILVQPQGVATVAPVVDDTGLMFAPHTSQ